MNRGRVLGAILAGGAGQRVGGADKGLLPLHGEPVAARVAAGLRRQSDRIVIVANRNLDQYARIARTIRDHVPGHAGPLAGIVAALALVLESGDATHADCRWLLTVPVDCPDFPPDLFSRLYAAVEASPELNCVYARDGHKVQPLFALYSLQYGEHLLESARRAAGVHASPLRWHMELGAKPVDFDDQSEAFQNLNALSDFRAYEASHAPPRANHPTRIGLELALEVVAARAAQHRMPAETVALADAAGRVLAAGVQAPHPLPPFANAAMDGFAVRSADLSAAGERVFELVGEVLAGAVSAATVGEGQCVRVTTGAPLPDGADTVVIKENARVDDAHVTVKDGQPARAHVRKAGEDYAQGDLAFAAGTPLGAAALAVVAAFGIPEVSVRGRPRVAIIATGDELVPPGTPLGPGQIHESNAVMLAALAREAGMQVMLQRCVRDDPDALRDALLDAAADADLVVSSGGVSTGEADHLPRVLQAIGDIHFHKVRVKPGMPMLFGQIGACLYFGLPGNPVAAAVTFRVFVRFALRAMLGITVVRTPGRARLAVQVQKRHARAEFMRCRLHTDEQGVQWATPHARQGSAMLRGLAESDALALLPDTERTWQQGEVVTLWPA